MAQTRRGTVRDKWLLEGFKQKDNAPALDTKIWNWVESKKRLNEWRAQENPHAFLEIYIGSIN